MKLYKVQSLEVYECSQVNMGLELVFSDEATIWDSLGLCLKILVLVISILLWWDFLHNNFVHIILFIGHCKFLYLLEIFHKYSIVPRTVFSSFFKLHKSCSWTIWSIHLSKILLKKSHYNNWSSLANAW